MSTQTPAPGYGYRCRPSATSIASDPASGTFGRPAPAQHARVRTTAQARLDAVAPPTRVPILRFSEPVAGVVTVAGEVDLDTAPLLEDHLLELTGSIRLDMRAVTFIDSSGVRALSRMYDHCEGNGCTLRIEACSPEVERILQNVGLYDILTEDEDGALAVG